MKTFNEFKVKSLRFFIENGQVWGQAEDNSKPAQKILSVDDEAVIVEKLDGTKIRFRLENWIQISMMKALFNTLRKPNRELVVLENGTDDLEAMNNKKFGEMFHFVYENEMGVRKDKQAAYRYL